MALRFRTTVTCGGGSAAADEPDQGAGAAADAGTAWEEGATIGIRAEVRSLTCLALPCSRPIGKSIIGNEMITNVGKSESCMVSELPIIFKRTRSTMSALNVADSRHRRRRRRRRVLLSAWLSAYLQRNDYNETRGAPKPSSCTGAFADHR